MTDENKLDDLDERIAKARGGKSDEDKAEHLPKSPPPGSEFLALVISGALLGYGIDRFFSTAPWGMIFMILMGFVAGVYRANAAMKKNDE